MGSSATLTGLPPLPPGAKMTPIPGAPATGGNALPPLPPGAKMNTGAPPAPAAPQTGMQKLTDTSHDEGSWLVKNFPETKIFSGMGSGAINSGAHLLGNVLDMIATPAAPIQLSPTSGPHAKEPQQPTQTPVAQYVDKHLHDAATWLRSGGQPTGFWQNVGAAGEQMVELLGTDGLLKLAGPAAGALETGEHLKQAQQAAGFLASHPKIAGLVAVGLKASKDALMMGSQTYGHTGDTTQALESAAVGGTLSAGAAGASKAVKSMASMGPKTLNVAGEEIPALASQVEKSGMPNASGAEGAPKIQQAQQAGAQRVIGHTAQDATENVLNQINETRPVYAPVPGRASLPAPEGSKPFTFTLETGKPFEGRTEMSVQEPGMAAKFEPTGSRVPEGGQPGPQNKAEIGSAADTAPGRLQKRIQAWTSKTGEVSADEARGAGALTTTDPRQAEGWLQQLEDVKASPAYDELPARQQGQLEAQRKALQEQLGLYHASPYAQRFSPADVSAAVGQVRTFGDAAAQVQAAVKPVYETLDQKSGGEFTKWNGQVKQAQNVIRSATSMEAVDQAQVRLSEANEAIQNLITRYGSEISDGDYRAAKLAWRSSSRLSELHTTFERMMNGITPEESDQGFQRVMTGRTKALQNYLSKGTNQAQIEQLIGKEGVTNLKQITELLSNVGTARTTASVVKNVFMELGKHARVGGVPGMLGGMAAYHMGAPWFEGMAAGAAAGEGMRAILRSAATSPRIGNMVNYAVRNGISPQIYSPLIARAIVEPFEEQKKPDQAQPAQEAAPNE